MIPIRSGGVDPVPHLTTHQLEIKTKPSRKTLSESARLQTPSLRSIGCKEACSIRALEDFLRDTCSDVSIPPQREG